jgi:transcription-repair coupling factor (superfamily II helicase)
LPKQVEDLFDTVRCRKLAVAMGFERMILKEDTLKCYFINKADSPYFESPIFKHILEFIQKQTNKAKLRQTGKLFMLVVDDIFSMQHLLQFMQQLNGFVEKIDGELETHR